MKVEEIIENVINGTKEFVKQKNNKEGGKQRSIKGKTNEKFFNEIITSTLKDTSYKLPYAKKIKNINFDAVIEDNDNNTCFFLEYKDYIDLPMLERFLADAAIVVSTYPKAKFGIFGMQSAFNLENVSIIVSEFNKNQIIKINPLIKCFLNTKRKSSDNTYILNYQKSYLINNAKNFINEVSGWIKHG